MSLVHRHQMLRKRGHIKTGKAKRLIYVIDVLAYVVSILSLLSTSDQLRIIWIDHNAAGVSLVSWFFYTLSSVVWFGYGYVHEDNIILTTNALWVMCDVFILLGIILYR
jgi:uncharacterized protein with PQ loop repeat